MASRGAGTAPLWLVAVAGHDAELGRLRLLLRDFAGAFVVTAGGMTLLAHVGATGSYVRDVLPGMLVAGLGLGVAVVSVSIAILTGAREQEAGMISGLNATGHEIGGTIGIAIFSTIAAGTGVLAGPQAASGISHAFIAAAILASVLIGLLHCDVGHDAGWGGAVPVVLAGLEEDAVAGADLLDRCALTLAAADALCDVDRLAERVGVPGGAGARGEVDAGGRGS